MRSAKLKSYAVILAAGVLLASCGDSANDAVSAEGSGAQGEVLEGSISDDMLALDQVKSQSPRMKPEPGEGGDDSATASDGDGEADGEGESEATDTPAEAAQDDEASEE